MGPMRHYGSVKTQLFSNGTFWQRHYIGMELSHVDFYYKNKQTDDDGTKNQSDKPENIHSNNYPKNGNQRMGITPFVLYIQAHQIVMRMLFQLWKDFRVGT